ncbi:D-alanyl-D-alanine carboxypeptidase family protein [Anaerosalibacter massiliensis]|uniref:serine-type D-Ala-D-Ala carboxypeptidase n=1 Tax=Anaerosalibacter massiliensis TaxID=1347392 RepID=A0A9X2S5J4_9FIRM|nr:D-alanyl-D-alanine carboxypeptidase family protein [Anaerosalibacter massiliensis]MCR2042647.1 D-alanyl-D-alanine carboxypeptidase [Anaerosalibacter massiliensis]
MNIKVVIISFIILFFITSISYTDPVINAESSILIDVKSGRILYTLNPNKKMPMASTTKIMTALVALENGDLDDKIKVEKDFVGIEGSSIYIYEEEKISLRDLLYGLMLRSGNDAAMVIADHIGGDVENFVNLMNDKAKEIGALNTNFTNPHGLEDENHYTTAYDLGLISREALKHETFKEIVSSKSWTANRDKNNYFYNKNKTLWQYDGGDGVKTGYTKRAGRCLVSSATKNGMQLVSVVLNDRDWFNDCYKLLDYGFENYKPYFIYDKGQFIKNIEVENGNKEYLPIVTDSSCILPLKEEEKERIKVTINLPENIEAAVNKGDIIGKISVYLDGELIYTSNLIAKEEIKGIGFLKKLKKSL